MPKVPMVRTRQSAGELAAAMLPELKTIAGANQSTGAVLLAHILIETASGDAVWNHNVGNITTGNETDEYWQPEKGEASKLKFRVYPSLADGMRGYIGFLKSRPKMLTAASSGDLGAFSERIKLDGYNPAVDVSDAAGKLLKLAADKSKLFADLPAGPPLTNNQQAAGTNAAKPAHALVAVLALLAVTAGAGFLMYQLTRAPKHKDTEP